MTTYVSVNFSVNELIVYVNVSTCNCGIIGYDFILHNSVSSECMSQFVINVITKHVILINEVWIERNCKWVMVELLSPHVIIEYLIE